VLKPEAAALEVRTEAGALALPIDVEAIARRRGARVVYEPMARDLSGLLYRDGDTVVIGVNSIHAPVRQRFTIAHEVGHLVLHDGRPVVLDHVVRVNFRDPQSGTATNREEIDANRFAAELLMPRDLVLDEVRRSQDAGAPMGDQFVRDLAEGFGVSAAALTNRLMNLGLLSQL
jgi:Zn-dependent peptidase ImmA (M78 family)